MSEPFIGEVRATSFNFAPKGWALCNGQLLSIAQNQALFSILGTTYGGDGVTTFALPNLQGCVPVGTGNGTQLGQRGGETAVTLLETQIPAHAHSLAASASAGAEDPANRGPAAAKTYGPPGGAVAMAAAMLASSGGSQPHDNMQPYLTINYLIALTGIYPSHS
jgi:microcystin-dependent protein